MTPFAARPRARGGENVDGAPRIVNTALEAGRRTRPGRRLSALAATAALAAGLGACTSAHRLVESVPPPSAAWPTVQGNQQRAGHAEQPAPEQAELEWTVNLGRGFRSEPLVGAGVVIVTGSNRLVTAVGTEEGELFWERRLDGSLAAAPVWRRDTLWVAEETEDGRLLALRLRDGDERWDRRLGRLAYAPMLRGNRLYVATEAGLAAAVLTDDGEVLWRTRIPRGLAATPVLAGGQVLVVSRADTLYGLEQADGTIARRLELPAGASASPAVTDGTMLVPTHQGQLVAVALDSLAVSWITSVGAPILAAPVVAPDGTIYLLNTAGEVWRVPPGGREAERLVALGGAARSSLTLARDRLIVGLLDGSLFLLRPDGTRVWELDLEDSIVAPVAVSGGAIYVSLLRGSLAKVR